MHHFYIPSSFFSVWTLLFVTVVSFQLVPHHHDITIVLAFSIPQPQPQPQPPLPSRRLLLLQRPVSFGNTRKVRCAVIPTPYFAENDDNNTNNNNDPTAKTPTTTTTVSSSNSNDTNNDDTIPTTPQNTITLPITTTNNNQSIFQRIDELAQQLKMAALQANAKAAIYTSSSSGTTTTNGNNRNYSWMMTKYRYYIQACIYYTLFLIYRAYRGFFIILPAVFRETFRKLQNAIDFDTSFDNNNNNNDEDNEDMTTTENDVVPTPKPLTIRTRITISILSILVLGTYVMGGAIRVTTSFLQSIWKGSSIVQSLQYAIQIQERNELSLLQKTKSSSSSLQPPPPSTTTTSIINGSTTSPTTPSSSLPDISTTSDPNRFAP